MYEPKEPPFISMALNVPQLLGVTPSPKLPELSNLAISAPPSEKAMVSAAGKKMPVLVSPAVVILGVPAAPAAKVAVDDADIVVAATVLGVVAPKVPFIAAPVSVLLVNVSVVALPTKVSVAAGSVKVVVPATAVAVTVVVPDVVPARTSVPLPSVEVAIIFL